jgi:hypothetical protein
MSKETKGRRGFMMRSVEHGLKYLLFVFQELDNAGGSQICDDRKFFPPTVRTI